MTAYVLDARQLDAKQLGAMKGALPATRLETVSRISHPLKEIESVASAYLLFYAFITGQTDNNSIITADMDTLMARRDDIAGLAGRLSWPVGRQGKPFPAGADIGGRVIYAGLSHSRGLVCAALSDCPVGIDLQQLPDMDTARMLRIAKRFHPDEYNGLLKIPQAHFAEAFCRLWACKESVIKLWGGLSQPLSGFCIGLDDTCKLNGKSVKINVKKLHNAYFAWARWI